LELDEGTDFPVVSSEKSDEKEYPILKQMGLLERGDSIDTRPSSRRFMADGKTEILLSFRQCLFIDNIIQTNDLPLACDASGIEIATAELWFANEQFRQYFKEIQGLKLKADRLTKELVKARVLEVVTGTGDKPGRVEGRILEVLYKDLCSSGPFGSVDDSGGWIFTAQKSAVKAVPLDTEDAIDAEPA